MHYRLLYSVVMISMIVVTGCTTSSKVDDFIQKAESEKIVTTTVSSSWTTDNQSDDLLIESSDVTDTTDGKRWIYKDYTTELAAQAKTDMKRLVIVVYDRSDDNTVKLDQAINTSLWRIPSDVLILKLDYAQAQQLYQVKNPNTVIYIDTTGKITYTSDGGIYTMDSLLYYL
jgi:hypothetical protein